jgi:hypothetical protein
MSNTAFVLGNGESRKGIQIEDLKKHGTVFACNGVYRTERPDFLVAVDPKMMLEIGETEYVVHNKVYSNYNVQYDKNQKILDHVQWFKPSLGWSSGPTALRLALEQGFTEIYMLGFDYKGFNVNGGSLNKFNNLFKDTRNYKKGTEEATFYGNWMSQTKRCLLDFKDAKFIRIIPKDWFAPKDLLWQDNLSTIITPDFLAKFNITIKK